MTKLIIKFMSSLCEKFRDLNWKRITLLSSCKTVWLLYTSIPLCRIFLSIYKNKRLGFFFLQSCSSCNFIVTYEIIITAHFHTKANYGKIPLFKVDIGSNRYYSIVQEMSMPKKMYMQHASNNKLTFQNNVLNYEEV